MGSMLWVRRIVKRFMRAIALQALRSYQMFLTYLSALIRRFVKDEEAASAIEYAVIATMVAVVVIAFVTPLGDAIKAQFNTILTGIGGTAVK